MCEQHLAAMGGDQERLQRVLHEVLFEWNRVGFLASGACSVVNSLAYAKFCLASHISVDRLGVGSTAVRG